jgi:hypothetical protein
MSVPAACLVSKENVCASYLSGKYRRYVCQLHVWYVQKISVPATCLVRTEDEYASCLTEDVLISISLVSLPLDSNVNNEVMTSNSR